MKQFYITISLILVFSIAGLRAQSIRKNHLEMTDDEKLSFVNALYQLRTGPDLMNDLANFHGDFFSFENTIEPNGLSIHLNLPDRPENDIFFAWHRRQMFEVEQAMQDIDANLSMPYWDSSTDQSVNSPLWDQNFMGQFDTDWSLGRTVGVNGSLPTVGELAIHQSRTEFLNYSGSFERQSPHTGAHIWTGGPMATPLSPRDPIFYLHHTNVDRWWSEWQAVNQGSIFQQTSLLRYDGNYVFDGVTLPLVNPNDIVDTRFFGTFYAVNGLVEMDNYTISNTYNAQELFYYQFTIQAGNNFIVPAGTDCKLESVNEIILQPGFEALSGSTFIATIDDQPVNKTSLEKRGGEIVRNQIPFDDAGELEMVYDKFQKDKPILNLSQPYPNPFSDQVNIDLNEKLSNGKILIYDMMGQIVKKQSTHDSSKIEILNLSNMSPGIYLLQLFDENNNIIFSKKIIKME